MTLTLVVLHVIVMFAATALAQGPAFLLWRAMRRGDVAGIRAVSEQFGSAARYIGPMYVTGVVIGLIAVFVGGYDPFAPWLIIAYVLTVIAFTTPMVVTGPRMARVAEAAAQSSLEAPSDDLRSAISASSAPVFWIDGALIVLFIIDMVAKPFS